MFFFKWNVCILLFFLNVIELLEKSGWKDVRVKVNSRIEGNGVFSIY